MIYGKQAIAMVDKYFINIFYLCFNNETILNIKIECYESYSLINGTLNFTLSVEVEVFYEKQASLHLCITNFTNVRLFCY